MPTLRTLGLPPVLAPALATLEQAGLHTLEQVLTLSDSGGPLAHPALSLVRGDEMGSRIAPSGRPRAVSARAI